MAEKQPREALEAHRTGEVGVQPEGRIDVSAQLLALEPGLFSIQVVAPRVLRTEGGMVLPCARFDPLPGRAGERAFLGRLAESDLLTPSAAPAYLRVTGRTSVLLTTYKASGPMPPPEIHVMMVEPPRAMPGSAPATPAAEPVPSVPLSLLVHVQEVGDIRCGGGVWGGGPEAGAAIEGFAVAAGPDLPADSIEYCAILGRDWSSPWMEGGAFCGSRQMALPLLGMRIRLRGEAAERFTCLVWGRFGAAERGPFADGAACEMDDMPLTGLRIAINPRRESVPPLPGAGP